MLGTSRSRHSKPTYGRQLLYGGLVLTTTFLLAFGLWYVTRLPSFTMSNITASGGVTIPAVAVETAAWATLEGTYYGLIPRRFVGLYPQGDIVAAVKSIPRLSSADITRTDTSLHIAYEEYVPYALWCEETTPRCLFIDEKGYAFAEAPQLSGGSLLRFVVEDAVLLPQQTIPLHEEIVRAVRLVEDLKNQFSFEVTDVLFKENKDRILTLSNGALLLTSVDQPDVATKENLAVVLKTEQFSSLTDESFAYIDLRFGDKVFINKTGDAGTTTASSSEIEAIE